MVSYTDPEQAENGHHLQAVGLHRRFSAILITFALVILQDVSDGQTNAQVTKETSTMQDQRLTGRIYDTSDNPFMTTAEKYGDPFPAYFDGVWHLYTLQGGLKTVRHLTSSDLVAWTEHKPAMTGGDIATGTVLRENDVYYMFYTIGQEAIGLVTSDNPWYFDKDDSRTVASPDPDFYPDAKPFRDVFVFRHEEEQLWWMLCEAHTKTGGVQIALLKATELTGPWKPFPPLYTQPANGDKLNQYVSCPQLIEQDGTWYLTYLNNATSYHIASNPAGLWGERKGQYNSDFLTAGSRSGPDGVRHLNWGFFSVRPTPENPTAQPRYGGPLGVGRELVFQKDKTIGVRPLPELVATIREPEHNKEVFPLLNELSGRWTIDAEAQKITSRQSHGGTVLIDVPDDHPDYYFETDVVFGKDRAAVSVTVRSTSVEDSGYRIALRPRDGIFEITEHTGQRRSYLSEVHTFGESANLKIFICDGQREAFVDDRSDLSTRVLKSSHAKIILEAHDKHVSFLSPLLHYFKQKKPSFKLILEEESAVFSVEPNQTRMATCYRDKAGIYHLFADYMTDSTISWNAEIRHYRSPDLRNWEYVETAVAKGEGKDPDAYGAASPHVLATDERIYLFYAGRANPVGGKADVYAGQGQTGYVAGRIMLTSARADEQGAPAEAFKKHEIVLEPDDGWDAMRLDDPCAVLDGQTVHLFFKGFDTNQQLNHVRAGYASARLADMQFTKYTTPVLAVPGGGEMPRVFQLGEQWHLFYHHFGAGGSTWRHHVADNPKHWELANARFFDGHGTDGPRDIMMIYAMNGKLLDPPKMLVTGTENGFNKLWLYRLEENN
ncbi:MAG: hypothetical protein KJT03_11460 [Verrucomicrobiae bacterium]|nr:hypothetical protein [Verrucomicrobiae bacterium]